MPVAAAVCGDLDADDRAAGGDRVAADGERACGEAGVAGGFADRGVERHLVDDGAACPVDVVGGDAGREQAVVAGLHRVVGRVVLDGDRGEPFGAADAGIAGDDQAERVAVFGGERAAVHGPGEEDVFGEGLGDGDRDAEGSAVFGQVGGFEGDVQSGVRVDAGGVKDAGERDAGPACVADGAGVPGVAGGGSGGLEVGAAVAGALQDGVDVARWGEGAELGHREVEGAGDAAVDAEAVGAVVEFGDVAVAADVEVRRFGDEGGTQPGERGLGVVGTGAVDDEGGHAAGAGSGSGTMSCRVVISVRSRSRMAGTSMAPRSRPPRRRTAAV